MRRLEASLAVLLATSTALLQPGCALSGKTKTVAQATPLPPAPVLPAKPATPPEPLSVAQTQVQLPADQPINPDALPVFPKTEEAAPAPVASRTPRRPPTTQPKPETPPATSTPTTAAAPPQEELPRVQEVLSAEDRKRLQDSATARKTEVQQRLTQVKSRHMSAELSRQVRQIQSLIEQVDNAEKRGDVRQADNLAERALILVQEMTGGK